jgi:hypothetical protein
MPREELATLEFPHQVVYVRYSVAMVFFLYTPFLLSDNAHDLLTSYYLLLTTLLLLV